jgi:type IV pilus assembly protein PilM
MIDLFKKKSRNFLGIDIGTTGIRMAQLKSNGEQIELENYAYTETKEYMKILSNGERTTNVKMSDTEILEDLLKTMKEAGITAQRTAVSIPTSSAFSSIMELPHIPDNEIKEAVNYEARQYIPLPLSEVVFDWSIIDKKTEKKNNNDKNLKQINKIDILLIAIPKEITKKYTDIIEKTKLELVALETESFSLARSLVGNNKKTSVIVDIGNKTTSIIIAENGSVLESHSVSGAGGEEITKMISHGFGVDFNRAESLKKDVGLTFAGPQKKVSEISLPVVNIIVSEIKKINDSYYNRNRKNIDRIIVSGSSANLPGLVDYFSKEIGTAVEIANPWKNIVYDQALSKKLKQMSPYFSVAVGLALRGFEE